jgi:cystathionine beta-synthase
MHAENILGTIGGTPLVKLNRVTKEICFNTCKGGDIQSREFNQRPNGAKMIDDAEADGRLQPGGTIRDFWKHWNGISACSNY